MLLVWVPAQLSSTPLVQPAADLHRRVTAQHHRNIIPTQNPAVQKTLKTSHTLPDKNYELGHICFPAPLQKAAQLPDQHF